MSSEVPVSLPKCTTIQKQPMKWKGRKANNFNTAGIELQL